MEVGLAGDAALGRRQACVLDDEIVGGALHLIVGAEAGILVLSLRRSVDPAPLIAGERELFVVRRNDVLAQLGAYGFEEIAEVPDDREVPENGVAGLRHVVEDDDDEDHAQAQQPDHQASESGTEEAPGKVVSRQRSSQAVQGRGHPGSAEM